MDKFDEGIAYEDVVLLLEIPAVQERIQRMIEGKRRSLLLDYDELSEYGQRWITTRPGDYIRVAETSIQRYIKETYDEKRATWFRIRYLPLELVCQVRELRSSDIAKLRTIQGIITKVSEVRPKCIIGAFRCTSCGFEQDILQDQFKFTEPLECPKEDGGCGKRSHSTTFKYLIANSLFIDLQMVEIQDIPELLEGRAQPQKRYIYLEDDLVDELEAGDRVNVVSIVKLKQRRDGKDKSSSFDTYLFGIAVEKAALEEDLEPTDAELEIIKEIARGEPIKKISRCIAPTIFGIDDIKMGILLAIIGAPRKIRSDGSERRGDIHILLAGDPSTGKSDLLDYIQHIHPRAIYGSGRASSAAGLTAAVVKDEFGDGRYTLEAGLMVLADGGLALIDELDKMRPEDRSSLHEAMERQTVTITKVIRSTLRSRAGVIGVCNPKTSVFKKGFPLSPQIDLDPTLQARFSLIYCLLDSPDPVRDEIMAAHNLAYTQGTVDIKDEVPIELLRKYIYYAKRIRPDISPELQELIAAEYARTRCPNGMAPSAEDRPITIRQLEDIQRMCEASARLRLDPHVNEYDVELSFALLKTSLKAVTAGADGELDINTLNSGIAKGKRAMISEVIDILVDLGASTTNFVKRDLLDEEMVSRGYKPHEGWDILGILYEKGVIFYPRDNDEIGMA